MPAVEQGKSKREGSLAAGFLIGGIVAAVASGFIGGGSSDGNGNTAPGTTAPRSSAPRTAGEATHTEPAAPAPKQKTAKAIGGISFWGKAFKDDSGNVTIVTCYGDPPQHATNFNQLSGATTDSYMSGDAAGGVNCELNITTLVSDEDAYAGVANVHTGSSADVTGFAEGNRVLSTQQQK